MSFNNTTLDPSSFFTYNEAINFIHSLDKCNSDKDCPQDSNCISNNCVVTFYCKNDDRCAFYRTICDGKPCKKDFSCKTNDECLSDHCNNNNNNNTICNVYSLSKYTSGTFTFKDVYDYFKNYQCQNDLDCPKESYCYEGYCNSGFRCKEKDESICAFGNIIKDGVYYFKDELYYDNIDECQANEDCLSALCTNGKCNRTYEASVSKDRKTFGLSPEESCISNDECASYNCRNGVCHPKYNIGKDLDKVLFLFGGFILVFISIIICTCIFACRIKSLLMKK